MAQVTMGFDLYCCTSPDMLKRVRSGNGLSSKMFDMHMWQGYADARAGSGKGSLWVISFPYMTWARGFSEGAISANPANPGTSFLVHESYLVRNFNQIALRRIW